MYSKSPLNSNKTVAEHQWLHKLSYHPFISESQSISLENNCSSTAMTNPKLLNTVIESFISKKWLVLATPHIFCSSV